MKFKSLLSGLFFFSFAVTFSGCTLLPKQGPSSFDIVKVAVMDEKIDEKEASQDPIKYLKIIDLTNEDLEPNEGGTPDVFSPKFTQQTLLRSDQQIVPGDIVIIRIWEAANDGLFSNNTSRETTLTLFVSNSGSIDVPYAGNVLVANRSAMEVRKILLNRLKGKAIAPEISIEIKKNTFSGVSVLGAVAKPNHFLIPSKGAMLFDVIAMAGGVPYPEWETLLTVIRRNVSETLPLHTLLDNSINNIVILPGDIIKVSYHPRKFAVYGAINKPGNISIDTPNPNLSDLLAESGGLNNMLAEANSVFVFRLSNNSNMDPIKATVYRFNFSEPKAFLAAKKFKLSEKDIVYVATADASEFKKFVNMLLNPFLGIIKIVKD
ncbi:MAG: hypothetical protein CSA29_05150 [Desulfobacterales bacterium]|nr:MAG: hypothetical protein CSA29_05150 [Desulfobacterales bacterium]